MRVLGLIPARGGSKSIPRKNLVDLGGVPLIQWTIQAALGSNLERVVVSTDDDEIAEISQSLGAEVPFKRPAELSSDQTLSIDVVLHALDVLEEDFDAVMMLQPTSPFRTSIDIESAIKIIEDASSVISVVPVEGTHPARMKFVEDGVLIDPPFAETIENMPRQELRPMYIRNGAIYLTRVSDLRHRTFKGALSRALIMPKERSINIDTGFDLALARVALSNGML
jgi:CMP-N,N'-diacetyllegionaminic acid synthase